MKILSFTVGATLALGLTCAAGASPAQAAPAAKAVQGQKFSSCAKLNKAYPHGVSKNAAAATKQVRQGYGRPATTKKAVAAYRVNAGRLDRDKDGTACER